MGLSGRSDGRGELRSPALLECAPAALDVKPASREADTLAMLELAGRAAETMMDGRPLRGPRLPDWGLTA